MNEVSEAPAPVLALAGYACERGWQVRIWEASGTYSVRCWRGTLRAVAVRGKTGTWGSIFAVSHMCEFRNLEQLRTYLAVEDEGERGAMWCAIARSENRGLEARRSFEAKCDDPRVHEEHSWTNKAGADKVCTGRDKVYVPRGEGARGKQAGG